MSHAVPRAVRMRRLTVSVLQALAVPSVMLLTASAAWAGCDSVAPSPARRSPAMPTRRTRRPCPSPPMAPPASPSLSPTRHNCSKAVAAARFRLSAPAGTCCPTWARSVRWAVWRSSSVAAAASKMRAASAPATTPRCSSSARATACWSTAERSAGAPACSSVPAMTAWTCRPAASAAASCRAMATTCWCWATVRSTASTRAVAMTR